MSGVLGKPERLLYASLRLLSNVINKTKVLNFRLEGVTIVKYV